MEGRAFILAKDEYCQTETFAGNADCGQGVSHRKSTNAGLCVWEAVSCDKHNTPALPPPPAKALPTQLLFYYNNKTKRSRNTYIQNTYSS